MAFNSLNKFKFPIRLSNMRPASDEELRSCIKSGILVREDYLCRFDYYLGMFIAKPSESVNLSCTCRI